MRVLITSDLHAELTGLETIRRLVAGMDREDPDLVVLAGDLGNPSHLFESCLACFIPLSCPIAVLPGNHDIWTSFGETSIALYEEILPEITASMGFHWLERDPLVLPGGFGVCGSIGWYDYSAREPSYEQTDEEIIRNKPKYAMDAQCVDWEYTDPEFAEYCRRRLARQIKTLEENPDVQRVMAATHVPVFEEQIDRHPDDRDWSLGNPYFGHLTMGEELGKFQKLRWVISGHTHVGLNGLIERDGLHPLATAVIASDYERPRWVTLEIDSEGNRDQAL